MVRGGRVGLGQTLVSVIQRCSSTSMKVRLLKLMHLHQVDIQLLSG